MLLLAVMATLQGAIYLTTGGTTQRIIGIAVLLASVLLLRLPMSLRMKLRAMVVLAIVGLANFVVHMTLEPEPYPARILQIAVMYGYSSMLLAGIGAWIAPRVAVGLLVSAMVLALGLTLTEASIYRLTGYTEVKPGIVRWEGGTAPHPILEEYYPPNSTARTIYASNPRGYFRTQDSRLQQWHIGLNHPGSGARLVLPGVPKDGIRMEIERIEVPTPWHVQATFGSFAVNKDDRYKIRFEVRGAGPRPFSYGVSQGHPPWENLGWYQKTDIGPEWREVAGVFRATSDEERARFTFDLGDDLRAVDIRGVAVEHFDTSESVIEPPTLEYAVSYRFNAQGCRGPDVGNERPAGRRRVLMLGDSYTLGVGVHEEDTFAVQLQSLLNSPAAARRGESFEVVNCGVSGYATKQERQLFEILGPVLQPDIVVLTMVLNDDRSWRTDVANGNVPNSTKYERLFRIFGRAKAAAGSHSTLPLDFRGSLAEVLTLKKLVEDAGARLVVISFRNQPLWYGDWKNLADTISGGLAGTGVPFLDVGDALITDENWRGLLVHADGDYHPNEIAHRSAAEQIAELLRKNAIVPVRSAPAELGRVGGKP
ncbi:GDSL-type esterase/lipase family protein [Thermomonas carbonis]|uniref:Carbohydrate binding domain-containing protein n=1 Tax=Thermomonas carbonis TaxID=1463158 RepID=A0A7G9SRU6_9GAMM|nr:GDSL-type esterase/lipase family protein [Thermomonas carbonis]QNN70571.1 carbohydrate binding domain-containing protein [Thermomonas carbonis]